MKKAVTQVPLTNTFLVPAIDRYMIGNCKSPVSRNNKVFPDNDTSDE